MLDGILPGQGGVERQETKLPEFIPDDVIVTVRGQEDLDDFPRGAVAHLESWDDDLALDLMVAGAALTLIDRATYDELEGHEDFDPEGFGILDDEGLWLPGLSKPFTRDEGGYRAPVLEEE